MTKIKKSLAILLALTLFFASMPMLVYAEETDSIEPVMENVAETGTLTSDSLVEEGDVFPNQEEGVNNTEVEGRALENMVQPEVADIQEVTDSTSDVGTLEPQKEEVQETVLEVQVPEEPEATDEQSEVPDAVVQPEETVAEKNNNTTPAGTPTADGRFFNQDPSGERQYFSVDENGNINHDPNSRPFSLLKVKASNGFAVAKVYVNGSFIDYLILNNTFAQLGNAGGPTGNSCAALFPLYRGDTVRIEPLFGITNTVVTTVDGTFSFSGTSELTEDIEDMYFDFTLEQQTRRNLLKVPSLRAGSPQKYSAFWILQNADNFMDYWINVLGREQYYDIKWTVTGIVGFNENIGGRWQFNVGFDPIYDSNGRPVFTASAGFGVCAVPGQGVPPGPVGDTGTVRINIRDYFNDWIRTRVWCINPNDAGNPDSYVRLSELASQEEFEAFVEKFQEVYGSNNLGVTITDDFFQYGFPAGFDIPRGGVQPITGSDNWAKGVMFLPRQNNGTLKLTKTSSNTAVTNGNKMYSLEGTTFQVKDSSNTVVATIVTKANGAADPVELPAGTYTVTETKAGRGYKLLTGNAGSKPVTIEAGETATVTFSNVPDGDPERFRIRKWDEPSQSIVPAGKGTTFQGAQYKIEYFDNTNWSGIPLRTWYFVTDSNGIIRYLPSFIDLSVTNQPALYSFNGEYSLPLGSVRITETKAPRGYLVQTQPLKATITQVDGKATFQWDASSQSLIKENPDAETYANEHPVAAGVKLMKVDKASGEALAGCTFTVFANETLNFDGTPRQKNDALLDFVSGVDGIAKTAANALPMGKYYVMETKPAFGYTMDREWKKEFEVTLEDNGKYFDFTTNPVENAEIIIHTKAIDDNTGSRDGLVTATASISDTISYDGLEPGFSYRFEGTLYNRTDSATVQGPDGKDLVVSKEFVTTESAGEIQMPPFTLDASAYAGKALVVLEKLYQTVDGTETLVAKHDSTEDEDQIIRYPEVHTTASDSKTRDHVGTVSEVAVVKDEVQLKNLVLGQTYTVKGSLVYKRDCVDKHGNFHTAGEAVPILDTSISAQTFEATAHDMVIELEYHVDSTRLQGCSVVVFEDLLHDDILLASHADLEDEDQSIHYPGMGTLALGEERGTHTLPEGQVCQVVDTVSYRNLLVDGRPYTLRGMVVFRDSGIAIGDEEGNLLVVEETFVPDTPDGEVLMHFPVDTTGRAGQTLVVWEELWMGDHLLLEHKDMEDHNQTVRVPAIRTLARAPQSGTHLVQKGKETLLTDILTYTALTPGERYTVHTVLMDRQTGQPMEVEGLPVEKTWIFIPEEESGTVETSFALDTEDLVGRRFVFFETLSQYGVELTAHRDLLDEHQTIGIVDIGTCLTGLSHQKGLQWDPMFSLMDTVRYEGLLPGKTYTLVGTLLDKQTGQPLRVKGEEVRGQHTFIPQAADGTVEVPFLLPGSVARGQEIVCFESLYEGTPVLKEDPTPIAVHKDLQDPLQTIFLPEPPVPNTGDGIGRWVRLLVVGAVCLVAVWKLRKKKKGKE